MEAKEFLIKLQKDLWEDRKNENCQADPIYYGIQDVEMVVVPEGFGDCIAVYDEVACEEISLEEFLADELANNEDWAVEMQEDEYGGFYMDESGEINITDMDSVIEGIKENCDGISVFSVQSSHYICPDVLFITRKDAEAHLKANRHHYTGKAHTYAMTAFRSPRYETLMKMLKQIDWENSEIKMLEESK